MNLNQLLFVRKCIPLFIALSTCMNATTLLRDDFNGTSLDLSLWNIVQQQGAILVSGGVLHTTGGDHNEIASRQLFSPDVTVTARIMLAGDFNLMGFYIQAVIPGAFYWTFDTYDNRFGPNANQIRMIRTFCDSSACVDTDLGSASVTWATFHNFTIVRQSASVQFLIDGTQVGNFANSYGGQLALAIENDRPNGMQTDWVQVDSVSGVPEPSLMAPILLILVGVWKRRKVGKFPA